MPRPQLFEKQITLKMPGDWHESATEQARRQGMTLSGWIRELIRKATPELRKRS